MTRRKRTPSPLSARKHVNFEIPASLQHLSALSKSLARQADSISGLKQEKEKSDHTSQIRELDQPLRSSKEASNKHQPVVEPVTSTTVQPSVQSQASLSTGTSLNGIVQQEQPHQNKNTTAFTNSYPSTTKVAPTKQNVRQKDGETLTLTKHAGEISALMAQKRAENEANKNRERWARAQSEHFAKSLDNKAIVNTIQSPSSPPYESVSPTDVLTNSRTKQNEEKASSKSTGALLAEVKPAQQGKSQTAHSHQYISFFSTPSASPASMSIALDQNNNNDSMTYPSNNSHTITKDIQKKLPSRSSAQILVSSTVLPRAHHGPNSNTKSEMISIPPLFSDHPRSRPVLAHNQQTNHHQVQQRPATASGSANRGFETLVSKQQSLQLTNQLQSSPHQHHFLGASNQSPVSYRTNAHLWTHPQGLPVPHLRPDQNDGLAVPVHSPFSHQQTHHERSQHGTQYQLPHIPLVGSSIPFNYYNPTTEPVSISHGCPNLTSGSTSYSSFAGSNGTLTEAGFSNVPQNGIQMPKR